MTTTTDTKLRTAAQAVLQVHKGNVTQAAPAFAQELLENAKRPLLVALVADYLARLPVAAAPPDVAEASFVPPEDKDKPPKTKDGRKGKRRPTGTPSPRARAGAIVAMKLEAAEIFNYRLRGIGRRVGELYVHELRALAKGLAVSAGNRLKGGIEEGAESIWLGKLADHCVTAHSFAKVKETIPVNVAITTMERARIMAAEIIRDNAAKVVSDLIASARPPQIEGGTQQ